MEKANLKKEKDIEKGKNVEILSNILYGERKNKDITQLVILCVGTDKIIGDCLGPLVGSKLKSKLKDYNISNINIYGTLEENISYINIEETLKNVNKTIPNAYLVIVDAGLSKKDDVGKIIIQKKETTLGKGLNKSKIKLGNLSITGIVAENRNIPKYNFWVLQNVSLNKVIKLANSIVDIIVEAIKYI